MITGKIETITPELAREYLKSNLNNPRGKKTLKRSTANRYANDMKSGKWETNGETIVFDEDGILKNGQHRLAAIILAGVPVKIFVVRGVSRDTVIFDIPEKRTPNQMVNAMGFECNPSITAAAGIVVNRFSRRSSAADIRDYAAAHIDELNRAFRVCCYGNNKYSKNAPCIAATYLVLRTQGMPVYEVELFWRLFNDIWSPADGYETGPAKIAREMFDDRFGKSGYQIQKERMEIIVTALNDFHNNQKRETKYKIAEPFKFQELMDIILKEDGLEE